MTLVLYGTFPLFQANENNYLSSKFLYHASLDFLKRPYLIVLQLGTP